MRSDSDVAPRAGTDAGRLGAGGGFACAPCVDAKDTTNAINAYRPARPKRRANDLVPSPSTRHPSTHLVAISLRLMATPDCWWIPSPLLRGRRRRMSPCPVRRCKGCAQAARAGPGGLAASTADFRRWPRRWGSANHRRGTTTTSTRSGSLPMPATEPRWRSTSRESRPRLNAAFDFEIQGGGEHDRASIPTVCRLVFTEWSGPLFALSRAQADGCWQDASEVR